MKFPTYTVKKSRKGKLVLGDYYEETGGAPRGTAMSGYVEETGAVPKEYAMGDADPWLDATPSGGSGGDTGILDSLKNFFGSVTGAASSATSAASSTVPLCQFNGKDSGMCREFDNSAPIVVTPGVGKFPAKPKTFLDTLTSMVGGGIAGAAQTNAAMTQAQIFALQQQQRAKQQQQMLIIGGLAVVGLVLFMRTRD